MKFMSTVAVETLLDDQLFYLKLLKKNAAYIKDAGSSDMANRIESLIEITQRRMDNIQNYGFELPSFTAGIVEKDIA